MKKTIRIIQILLLSSLTIFFQSCSDIMEKGDKDFIKSFIKDFNSSSSNSIDKYIKDKYFKVGKDGFRNFLSFRTDKIESSNIFSNISFNEFPKYKGNGNYEDYGNFINGYNEVLTPSTFDVELYDDSTEKNDLKLISEKCNFIMKSMTTDGYLIYTFYFSINPEEKYLLGITTEVVKDANYLNIKLSPIAFDNSEHIEEKILANNIFKDEDGYVIVDFKNKKINSYDYKGTFDYYELKEIKNISDFIKIREMVFYTSKEKQVFSKIYITNLGYIYYPNFGAMGDVKLYKD